MADIHVEILLLDYGDYSYHTVDGRSRAPVDMANIQFFSECSTSQGWLFGISEPSTGQNAVLILLMEEILHHLRWLKPYNGITI